jgi:Niemann-Pick C1 protein
MFGVGLDDGFVLITSLSRQDAQKNPVERVRDTIEDVGVSIFMTTLTTVLAFSLGCTTTIPSIRWLCMYAAPTIAIDFLYQITFFISIMVLDDRRIIANRRDCCICLVAKPKEMEDEQVVHSNEPPKKHCAEQFMIWYSDKLFRPWTKVFVVAVFTALFGLSIYSFSLIDVAFDFTDVLPRDSFLIDYEDASAQYAQVPAVGPLVYFRFVNQSDPIVRKKMKKYVKELTDSTPAISSPRPFNFWLYDYDEWYRQNKNVTRMHSFNDTLTMFLAIPEFNHHNGNLLLDDKANIIASRVMIELDNMDMRNVDEYMGAFKSLRQVTQNEAVNQNGEWPFFTFDPIYYLWEFLYVVQDQLIVNTIQGIVCVTLVALLLIPHWSAALIILPVTAIMYVDLVGFIQACGIDINGGEYGSIETMFDFSCMVRVSYSCGLL